MRGLVSIIDKVAWGNANIPVQGPVHVEGGGGAGQGVGQAGRVDVAVGRIAATHSTGGSVGQTLRR